MLQNISVLLKVKAAHHKLRNFGKIFNERGSIANHFIFWTLSEF